MNRSANPTASNGAFTRATLVHKMASDANQHADNLRNWQQEYDQYSDGEFHGSILELPLDQVQVFREYTSQSLHQQCNTWDNAIWLGFAETGQAANRINGLPVATDALMCRTGNTAFELITPEAFTIYGVVITEQLLQEVAQTQGLTIDVTLNNSSGVLNGLPQAVQQLRILVNQLLQGPSAQVPAKAAREMILSTVISALAAPRTNLRTSGGQLRKMRTVTKVIDRIKQCPQDNPSITELCAYTHTSRRALQYAFNDVMGVSPGQYLRAARLNSVRRALVQNAQQEVAERAPISAIAQDWGFWHMSQFAQDYRRLFGVLPSQTG